MKNVLIIYAHPDEQSFNHALLENITATLDRSGHPYTVLDLYGIGYNPVMTTAEVKGHAGSQVKEHQQFIRAATDIVFIFPVWWFRAPAMMEGFIDKTFAPKFAYRFKPLFGKYGMPIPLLKDKKVTAFITHGAPALPVKLLYLNAVKYRFLLGFLSFCFNIFRCKIVQLWSVPFINEGERKALLAKACRIIQKRIPPAKAGLPVTSKRTEQTVTDKI